MSLIKQLWLGIVFLMTIAFVGSFVVSCLSTKFYLEEQLYQKNIDNASMIALSLGNHSADPVFMELFISSQFDTGHYEYISLIDLNGDLIAGQTHEKKRKSNIPSWLPTLFPIIVKPGYAQVSDGWKRTATLILKSDSDYVYLQLWNNAKYLFYYFMIIAIATGLVGSFILRYLTAPLGRAVDHAEAIGDRRFIITEEPKTLEFRSVIRSMNRLSERVKTMLADEMLKLERLQKDMRYDQVTKLLSRDAILSNFASYIEREDEYSSGLAVIVRIEDMQHLNQRKGRSVIDALLKQIGNVLRQVSHSNENNLGKVGRLNGSDFLVILPSLKTGNHDIGRSILDSVKRCCIEAALPDVKVFGSITFYHVDEQVGEILSRLDSALLGASKDDINSCVHIDKNERAIARAENVEFFQTYLPKALRNGRFKLEFYPVKTTIGEILHFEAPVRLINQEGLEINAAQFITHVHRLELSTELDAIVVRLALEHIRKTREAVGVNISTTLLTVPGAMLELARTIEPYKDVSHLLWLEVPEYGVYQNFEGFRSFNQLLKPLKCKFGIEHVGHEVSCVGQLHDLGIDFVKIDSSFVRSIDVNTSNQIFLRGLCTILHSIGTLVIAEGVQTPEECKCLENLGFDGGTGRYYS